MVLFLDGDLILMGNYVMTARKKNINQLRKNISQLNGLILQRDFIIQLFWIDITKFFPAVVMIMENWVSIQPITKRNLLGKQTTITIGKVSRPELIILLRSRPMVNCMDGEPTTADR